MFSQRFWMYSLKQTRAKDILAILSAHVECVALIVKE